MPVSASYRGNLAPRNDSNQVQGACPLWGQFFICKIKNGGLDNAEPAEQVSAGYRGNLAPRNDSNQVQGACPLWGQFFICKIKNGG